MGSLVGDFTQLSGISTNDFIDTVTYVAIAEDGSSQEYKVWVAFESTVTSIEENNARLLNVYPVPFKDELKVAFPANTELSGHLTIINHLGQTVKTTNFQVKSQSGMTIAVGELPPGTYTVMLRIGDKTWRKSIIKLGH